MKLNSNTQPLMILAGLFCAFLAKGQQDSTALRGKKSNKVAIIPMPVVAANPTTGLMLGVSTGVSFVNGDALTTSISNYIATVVFTTKKQRFISLRGTMFFEGDKWILSSDMRFYKNSQPTYGLSTKPQLTDESIVGGPDVRETNFKGPDVSEMMSFNHVRFYQTLLKRWEETRLFYGFGYHLDLFSNIDDKELDLGARPPVLTHHYRYQTAQGLPMDGYRVSGVSLNLSYDSRDIVVNPYEGRLAAVSFLINPSFIGSTASSTRLWMEYRDYFNLSESKPRHLLAFWAFGWFVTSGKAPYLYLPATSNDMFSRSGRPYTTSRFRGEDLFYTELEWRFPLQKNKNKLGGVLFTNLSSASSRTEQVGLFSSAQLGYGAGLRYLLNEKKRVNICIDYGFGRNGASGLFLNLNEAF